MKAIYLNIDPYLQAVAEWLNAGKPGTAPSFNPLPVAVTIPLGESASLYLVADAANTVYDVEPQAVTINGAEISILPIFEDSTALPEGTIAFNQTPGFSAIGPSLKYAVIPVSGSSASATYLVAADGVSEGIYIPITVLVRRETASGPVDLVDFTPPAAAPSAADIKSALVEAGAEALEGVSIKSTKWGDTSLTVAAADSGNINTLVGYLAASD